MSAPVPASDAPWELLAKQLAGEATPAEQAELQAWVQAQPERQQWLRETTRAWEQATPPTVLFTEASVETAWQRFRTRENIPAAKAEAAAQPEARVVSMWASQGWLRVAAAILLLLGAVGLWRLTRSGAPASLPMVAVEAGSAVRVVGLPDGSKVWLNRQSSLRYAAGFRAGQREVQLTGEAFFEVTKNPQRPFTVLSSTSRTQVLGTSFNVRAYPGEDSVEVSVVTGKVAFGPRAAPADTVLLLPGRRGVVQGKQSQRPRRTLTADPNFRAWQQQEMSFDNAPVAHVLRTLETTFHTHVAVSDSALLTCRFTGTFPAPTPAQVLRVLSLALSAELSTSPDGSYVLRGAGCSAAGAPRP
ncbi:FecR family protein [Hymenobacter guriensis]|uniref:FecR domain-containing protein n=1 Tax=Hymenobacter guriensis TaxID=2793065 RepID=A0ABS0KZN9_9BACT|nr:FecR domain-containing protein [Hymenobacter guriensis]MBG8553332.1 FecR domain-containing protein [Hymenobacter guriensis]